MAFTVRCETERERYGLNFILINFQCTHDIAPFSSKSWTRKKKGEKYSKDRELNYMDNLHPNINNNNFYKT